MTERPSVADLCARIVALAPDYPAGSVAADVRAAFAYLQSERDEAEKKLTRTVNSYELDYHKIREERDAALARVEAFSELVASAAPLTWATFGFPEGTGAAVEWEKQASALLAAPPTDAAIIEK